MESQPTPNTTTTTTTVENESRDIFGICAKGNFDKLKKYFSEGFSSSTNNTYLDIDKIDKNGQTPLIVALKNKKDDCAEFLISIGCNVNFTDKETRSALMYASYLGLSKCAKLLFYADADITLKDKYGRTALTYSAIGGYNSIFDFLIDHGSYSQFELEDVDGFTPIMHASTHGHDRIVKKLLKLKTGLEKDDKNGKTPIHLAIEGGHEKIAKMLVDAGADVNKKDKEGRSTLMKAIVKDQQSVLKDLVQKVDVNEKDNHGVSALMVASILGDKSSVELLVEKGADVNETNSDGQSALMLAAGVNEIVFDSNNTLIKDINDLLKKSDPGLSGLDDLKEFTYILTENVAKERNNNLPETSTSNDSELLGALSIIDPLTGKEIFVPEETSEPLDDLLLSKENLGHNDIIISLVEANADVNIKDKDGKSALFYAAQNESTDVVNILIDSGADINITDNDNIRLLDLLKELDDEIINDKVVKIIEVIEPIKKVVPQKIIEQFEVKKEEVETKKEDDLKMDLNIISAGVDNNFNNEKKFEINDRLNEVIPPKEDEKTELRHLLKFKGPTGQNILMIAAFKGQMDIAKKIVGHLDINAKDFNGFTALSFAAQSGNVEMIDFILSAGSLVEEKNVKTTLTPLALSITYGHSEAAKKLINAGANVNFKIKGLTLLMTAINKKDLKLVNVLLDGGADINETDHRGKNALAYAKSIENNEIINAINNKLKSGSGGVSGKDSKDKGQKAETIKRRR
ncbi:MAG: ankyrin repeat domain-containing protein [Oligoflexia bacterium]|nr:ankyrin repeat domain-containing protein [Oligoflexia bacterium]